MKKYNRSICSWKRENSGFKIEDGRRPGKAHKVRRRQ
jgi:hypothetical protein